MQKTNSPLYSKFIGNFNLAMSLEEDEPIDPNKTIYCLTAKGGTIESGSTLEVKGIMKERLLAQLL